MTDAHPPSRLRGVRIWLWTAAFLVALIVIVGGATRLTESGLSITEWRPVAGTLPPLSADAWNAEFAKYREIPQYRQVNEGMSLAQFKVIYWWEWTHRLLGRLIGFAFAVPLAFFWLTGRVGGRLGRRLLVILALGGLQGAIGWWMVTSGLTERVSVAPYRLATHLSLAFLIFATIVWVAVGLRPRPEPEASPAVRGSAWIVMGCIFLQAFLGAIVAGLDAGMTFNTWPLMDGRIVPPLDSLLAMEPAWRNLFESPMTAQFAHRMAAYLLLLLALVHMLIARRQGGVASMRAGVLFLLVLLQAMLGVLTLIHVTPIGLALAHQFGALLVIGHAVAHLRRLTPQPEEAAPGRIAPVAARA